MYYRISHNDTLFTSTVSHKKVSSPIIISVIFPQARFTANNVYNHAIRTTASFLQSR